MCALRPVPIHCTRAGTAGDGCSRGWSSAEFSQVFNFAIIGYSRNSRKLDARKKLVFYSILAVWGADPFGPISTKTGTVVEVDDVVIQSNFHFIILEVSDL